MNPQEIRVLVVDDDAELRTTTQQLLESEGFSVSVAANGSEALDLLRRRPADIVLTDVFMPEKDGIETIVDLHREFPQAKVIVMSGSEAPRFRNVMVAARELGATRSLPKPLDAGQLIATIRELASSPPTP
jgi:CheY-like chemotaxis protein